MSSSNKPVRSDGGSPSKEGRKELEKRLAAKKASINERIDDLEEDVTSLPAAVKSSIRNHPLLGVAGAVAAGLAVGWLVTRSRKPEVAPFHQRLVEEYMDAVGDDVRYRVKRGRPIEEAVHESLRGRAPFILYAPERERERDSKGFFAEFGDIALKTALGFTVKTAIDLFTARLDVEEFERMLAMEEEPEHEAEPVPGGDGVVDRTAEAP